MFIICISHEQVTGGLKGYIFPLCICDEQVTRGLKG